MRIPSSVISFSILFAALQFTQPAEAGAQEYARAFPVKEDSVMQQVPALARYLQQIRSTTTEARREYRDSLAATLAKTDTIFARGTALQPEVLVSKLPHPAIRLISDLAWNDFVLTTARKSDASLLPLLAAKYPREINIQGNLVAALEVDGLTDSAIAVADRFIGAQAGGYSALNIDRNILFYKSGSLEKSTEIINLGSDSFRIWVQDKLFKYPAAIDSLRNALAAVISQRAGVYRPPDPVLGQLILDYGDLSAREKIYQPALEYFELAAVYDPGLKKKTEQRIAVIHELEKSVQSTFTWASIIFAVPLLAFVLIFVGWIRNRRGGK